MRDRLRIDGEGAGTGCSKMPRTRRTNGAKRHPLNMRTTKELREALEHAASRSGRSLVQEVEFRLEQSFLAQDLTSRLLGGGDHADLLRLITMTLPFFSNSQWPEKVPALRAMQTAVETVVAGFVRGLLERERPRGLASLDFDYVVGLNMNADPEVIGKLIANFVLATQGFAHVADLSGLKRPGLTFGRADQKD